MMFQIMTEQQLKQANEQTLRQRVRELSNVTAVFREIRDTLQKCNNILLVIADNTRRRKKRKPRKTKTKRKR